jgi:hypothetical protein
MAIEKRGCGGIKINAPPHSLRDRAVRSMGAVSFENIPGSPGFPLLSHSFLKKNVPEMATKYAFKA